MKINALVPIANGSEEIEAVCVVDILRRADVEVTVAVVPSGNEPPSLEVTASRGVLLKGDCFLMECVDTAYCAIILPGGLPGAEYLRDNLQLRAMLIEQDEKQELIAAICASPAVILQHQGLIRDRRATCYPALMEQLPASSRSAERVVVAGNLITSRGPGTAFEFSLALVQALCGQEKRDEIADQLLFS